MAWAGQLLGGYGGLGTTYLCDPEQVLEALKKLRVSEEDEPLLKFTIATFENPQRRDLST